MAGFAQETATARLSRLLTMVPWLVNRQGIDLTRPPTTSA
jgi:proteasome accessory factor C